MRCLQEYVVLRTAFVERGDGMALDVACLSLQLLFEGLSCLVKEKGIQLSLLGGVQHRHGAAVVRLEGHDSLLILELDALLVLDFHLDLLLLFLHASIDQRSLLLVGGMLGVVRLLFVFLLVFLFFFGLLYALDFMLGVKVLIVTFLAMGRSAILQVRLLINEILIEV